MEPFLCLYLYSIKFTFSLRKPTIICDDSRNTTEILSDEGMYGKNIGEIDGFHNDFLNGSENRNVSNDYGFTFNLTLAKTGTGKKKNPQKHGNTSLAQPLHIPAY
jgi:hypothetical protein